jgi:rod shape determining protein RodA
MRRQIDILANIDWLSVFLFLALVTFGWLNIFAVNYSPSDGSFFSLGNRYAMQLIWIFISLIAVVFIFVIDSRFYLFFAYPAYALGILALLIVLLIGTAIHSSKSWIVLGPVSIQPSEFAKVATVLAIAKYVSGYNTRLTRLKDILVSLAITFFPAGLIALQPDIGSVIVYGILLLVLYREGLPGWVLLVLLAIAGLFLGILVFSQFIIVIVLIAMALIAFSLINKKPLNVLFALLIGAVIAVGLVLLNRFTYFDLSNYIILLTVIAGIVVAGVIYAFVKKVRAIYTIVFALILSIGFTYTVNYLFNNVLQEHHRHRVNVMLGLESDPYGYEYNVRQSKIAIGSGGFSGKGFLQGTQTKFRFVPEQSTDFIFCTVGEEWGFLGSFGLVLVYIGLLLRLIILAERQRSSFSRIYGYGVLSILFFHFAINIGMTIGLFPVIGIPLPFLSYGGSSLFAFTIMLFIFIRLDSTRKAYLV